jgi:hypothetical protein
MVSVFVGLVAVATRDNRTVAMIPADNALSYGALTEATVRSGFLGTAESWSEAAFQMSGHLPTSHTSGRLAGYLHTRTHCRLLVCHALLRLGVS